MALNNKNFFMRGKVQPLFIVTLIMAIALSLAPLESVFASFADVTFELDFDDYTLGQNLTHASHPDIATSLSRWIQTSSTSTIVDTHSRVGDQSVYISSTPDYRINASSDISHTAGDLDDIVEFGASIKVDRQSGTINRIARWSIPHFDEPFGDANHFSVWDDPANNRIQLRGWYEDIYNTDTGAWVKSSDWKTYATLSPRADYVGKWIDLKIVANFTPGEREKKYFYRVEGEDWVEVDLATVHGLASNEAVYFAKKRVSLPVFDYQTVDIVVATGERFMTIATDSNELNAYYDNIYAITYIDPDSCEAIGEYYTCVSSGCIWSYLPTPGCFTPGEYSGTWPRADLTVRNFRIRDIDADYILETADITITASFYNWCDQMGSCPDTLTLNKVELFAFDPVAGSLVSLWSDTNVDIDIYTDFSLQEFVIPIDLTDLHSGSNDIRLRIDILDGQECAGNYAKTITGGCYYQGFPGDMWLNWDSVTLTHEMEDIIDIEVELDPLAREIKQFMDFYFDQVTGAFPISWAIELQTIFNDVRDEVGQTVVYPSLLITMDQLDEDINLFPMESVAEDFEDVFTLFRSLMIVTFSVSFAFVVFFRVRSFIKKIATLES